MNYLEKRIVGISYKHKLSHIGSCLTTLPILQWVYAVDKKANDLVVLSNGHAGLALYVMLEHYYGADAEILLQEYGIHPCRNENQNITVSSGSLGSAITIAAGLALADKDRQVHCVISDGEMAEGTVWETLNFCTDNNLTNLRINCNVNGWGAYSEINKKRLFRLSDFYSNLKLWETSVDTKFPFLQNLDGHYHILTDEEAELMLKDED